MLVPWRVFSIVGVLDGGFIFLTPIEKKDLPCSRIVFL